MCGNPVGRILAHVTWCRAQLLESSISLSGFCGTSGFHRQIERVPWAILSSFSAKSADMSFNLWVCDSRCIVWCSLLYGYFYCS